MKRKRGNAREKIPLTISISRGTDISWTVDRMFAFHWIVQKPLLNHFTIIKWERKKECEREDLLLLRCLLPGTLCTAIFTSVCVWYTVAVFLFLWQVCPSFPGAEWHHLWHHDLGRSWTHAQVSQWVHLHPAQSQLGHHNSCFGFCFASILY